MKEWEALEFLGQIRERGFDAHPFERGGANEADAVGGLHDPLGIGRRVDRAAVAEVEDVVTDGPGGIDNVLGALDGVLPANNRFGHADRAADGGADMGDDRIRPGFRPVA